MYARNHKICIYSGSEHVCTQNTSLFPKPPEGVDRKSDVIPQTVNSTRPISGDGLQLVRYILVSSVSCTWVRGHAWCRPIKSQQGRTGYILEEGKDIFKLEICLCTWQNCRDLQQRIKGTEEPCLSHRSAEKKNTTKVAIARFFAAPFQFSWSVSETWYRMFGDRLLCQVNVQKLHKTLLVLEVLIDSLMCHSNIRLWCVFYFTEYI